MESARDKHTGEIVEAESLWLLDSVDTDGYECWGCGIDMYPSSWQKSSKKRPSFNKKPGKVHAVDCDVDAEPEIVSQGQKRSVHQHLDSAPGLSPSALKLVDKRPAVDLNGNDAESHKKPSVSHASTSSDKGEKPERESRRPAQTIRPICRAFIRFPYDRDMSLNVPGIDGHSYMTVFSMLGSPVKTYSRAKIFYAELLGQKMAQDDDELVIPLSGEWAEGKPSKAYLLHIKWSSWSKAKKTQILNELTTAQAEAREAWIANKQVQDAANDVSNKSKKESMTRVKKSKAWVFFIGEQDQKEPAIFYVDDNRLICTLMGYLPPVSKIRKTVRAEA